MVRSRKYSFLCMFIKRPSLSVKTNVREREHERECEREQGGGALSARR